MAWKHTSSVYRNRTPQSGDTRGISKHLQHLDPIRQTLARFLSDEQTKRQYNQRQQKYGKGVVTGILTQNVQGFTSQNTTRSTWMASWKRNIQQIPTAYILLQETHVNSADEALTLTRQWASQWGHTHDESNPLSYWSVSNDRKGGVAILKHPNHTKLGKLILLPVYRDRVMILETNTTRIINIYAPNNKKERDTLFCWLRAYIPRDKKQLIMGGDFNCVDDPGKDRITNGRPSPKRGESYQLEKLRRDFELVDFIAQQHDWNRKATPLSPTDAHYTHWQQEHGARLDRIYIQRCKFRSPRSSIVDSQGRNQTHR